MAKLYAEISKAEKQDGTTGVSGCASGGTMSDFGRMSNRQMLVFGFCQDSGLSDYKSNTAVTGA
ncbi:hypothetical protein D0T90_07375 [Neisseria animalis]|uniref:Uncharacterized protein n=2 Tax=Neisseria animalis TaxID=492 RepID=A0A5P3MUJ2_NEIAN|nr:hypothetical protein D0T90_07375 [Neisseria animalis]VEE06796.1 Uncharacterised protein [Neisseria animalis]